MSKNKTDSASVQYWSEPRFPEEIIRVPGYDKSVVVVLDTGATASLISQEFLENIGVGLSDETFETFLIADGKTLTLKRSKPFFIYISKNNIGIKISPLVIDLKSEPLKEAEFIANIITDYPLIIGMEDLWKTNFSINYKTRTNHFKKLKINQDKGSDKGISLELNVNIGGEVLKCLVDTGAPDMPGIYIPKLHPKYWPLISKFENFYPTQQVFSITGAAFMTHAPYATIDTLQGEGLIIEFENADVQSGMGEKCLIGGGILHNSVISRTENSFYTEGHLPPVEYNRLGFSDIIYEPSSKEFIIKSLYPHGPLALAGVKLEDRLLSVGGIPMTLENIPQARQFMRMPAGHTVTVEVSSPSSQPNMPMQVRELTVTLTDVLIDQ